MPPLPSHESTRSVAPPPLQDPSTQNPATPPQSDAAADRAALAHGKETSVTAKLEEGAPAATAAVSLSPLAPLSVPVFRMLWLTWVAANTCMWMNDVAAAWLMTTLTTSPILVALVQSASTLPVFLLGLPSGALADILDRRRYFIATQFWVAAVALVLCVAILAGGMTALLHRRGGQRGKSDNVTGCINMGNRRLVMLVDREAAPIVRDESNGCEVQRCARAGAAYRIQHSGRGDFLPAL